MYFTMRTSFILVALLVLLAPVGPVAAQNVGFALRAGTLGPGADLSFSVGEKLNMRAGAAYFSTTVSETIDEEDVSLALDGDATIGALSLLADFHPFRNSFRLTGGVRLNLFEGQANGRSLEPLCLGDEDQAGNCLDKEFSAEKVGTFGATVSYENPIQPYAGIGFGNLARGNSRVTMMLDLGVIYAGTPKLELEATGLLTPTATQNEAVLNEGIKSFVLYPVFSIGIGFRL